MTASIRNEIEKQLKVIQNESGLNERLSFQIYVVGLFHQKSDFSPDSIFELQERTTELQLEGSPGDDKLDGYHFDEDEPCLYLYQTKWSDSASTTLPGNDAAEIAQALRKLENDLTTGYSGDNGPRTDVIERLKTVHEQDGRIVLRAVCGSEWKKTALNTVTKELPSEPSPHVEVELYGLAELEELRVRQDSDLKGNVIDFKLHPSAHGNMLELPATPSQKKQGYGDAVICVLSGKSIGENTKTWKTRLFDRNVRSYLGQKGRNKAMAETIEDEGGSGREIFWHGHNGITILCEEILDPANAPGAISLANPQIVNGCQTATTLMETLKILKKGDVAVTARVVSIHDSDQYDDISDAIAFRTNNQSAVSDSDLLANDDIQRTFAKRLEDFGSHWLYERKRGEWNSLKKVRPQTRLKRFQTPKQADRRFTKEIYAQAWRSFTGDPSGAIAKKNEVWAKRGTNPIYRETFDKNRRTEDIVLTVTIFEWLLKVVSVDTNLSSLSFDFNPGLKKYAKHLKSAKTLVAAHSLAMFGYLVNDAYGGFEAYPQLDASKVIDNLDRGSKVKLNFSQKGRNKHVLPRFWEEVFKAWGYYLAAEAKRDPSIKLHAMLKQSETLGELIEILDNGLLAIDRKTIVKP